MLNVAVVGATGAVGRELLGFLAASPLPIGRIVPIASPRSAGRKLSVGGSVVVEPVVALDEADFGEIDVAFLTAGAEVSRQYGPGIAAAGCLVIDNSSAFRGRRDVPLPVPEVNPEVLARRPDTGIVANPNCSTIQLVRAIAPLHQAAGLRRMTVATYQAASGGGLRGLAELADVSRAILAEPTACPGPGRFGPSLAFDLIPQIGPVNEDGIAHEEQKIRQESRRILGVPDLQVSATAVRVAVFHCHSEAVLAEFGRPLTPAEAEAALATAPGIQLYPAGSQKPYPTPRLVELSGERRRDVHVGRVRADPDNPYALWLWVVADNLWVGAAFNALRIFQTGIGQDWWKLPA
jgi:aspartate-semialdehyde dehydrogenase